MSDESVDLAQIIEEVKGAALSAATPVDVGDWGIGVIIPEGYQFPINDRRRFMTEQPLPGHIDHATAFTHVESLATYVARHSTDDSLAYQLPLRSGDLSQNSMTITRVVLDEHGRGTVAHRDHVASLVLYTTEGVRRWARAFGTTLDQEQFVQLLEDGMGEIADPDAADLRDLARNLHAIRTCEVESVVRTGGEGTIKVSENVQLKAGAAREFTFPERITVVVRPFVGTDHQLVVNVAVRPTVQGSNVRFGLNPVGLDDQLIEVNDQLATDVANSISGVSLLWAAS